MDNCLLFHTCTHSAHVFCRKKKLAEVEKHEKLAPHPNCVQFYRAWEERHQLYIQIELCLMSLSECADLHGRLGNAVATKFLVDLIKVNTGADVLVYIMCMWIHTYTHIHSCMPKQNIHAYMNTVYVYILTCVHFSVVCSFCNTRDWSAC